MLKTLPVPYPERLFKATTPSSASEASPPPVDRRTPRYIRLRYGRGGRLHLDRRLPLDYRASADSEIESTSGSLEDMKAEIQERARRRAEQWRFDSECPQGHGDTVPDEDDRMLLDDYQPR